MSAPYKPSKLEKQLKKIVYAHPVATVHPHSSSGPYVRAVLWKAPQGILGRAFQESPEQGGGWVVEAAHPPTGPDTVVTERPSSMAKIPGAITAVIREVQKRYVP